MTVSEYVNKTMASVPGFGIQATGQEYDPGKGDWIITLSNGRRMYSNSPEFKELKSTGLVHMDTKYKTTHVQSGKLNPELQRFIDLEKENSFSEFLKRRDRLGQNYSQDPSNAPQSYKDDYDVEMNRKWAADFIERNPRNQDENRGQYLDRITKGLDQSIVDNLYRNLPEKEGTTYWEDSKRGINYLADALPGQNIEDYILRDPSLSQREKQERLQNLKNNPNLSRVMGGLETLSALSVPVEFVTAAGREDYSLEDAAGGVKNDTPLSTKFMLDPLNLMGFGIEGAALKGIRGARYLKGVDEAAGVVRYGDEVWDTSRVLNEAKVADKQFDLYSGLSRARESKSKYIRENIKNWLQEYKEGKISLEEYQKLTEVPNSFVNFKSLTSAAKNKGNALRTNQEEIVKNFNDFNNKTYTGGGNNLGVTPIGDNYIVRHSDKGYGDHANDMLIMSQGIDNPRVMRTVQVGEDNLGRTHQVQQRASGVTLDKLTQEQIDQIPLDHYKQLEADLNYLRERNIGIDPSKGDNFFYDKDKGFQFIDLSRSENPSNAMDNIFSTLKSDDGLIFNPNKSPNTIQTPSFKSDIDWGKWNPEIPNNKPLLEEYHQIEKAAKLKANGNPIWWGNDDGSMYLGPRERWIQEQSINFKKAYPDGFEVTNRGIHNNKLNGEQIAKNYPKGRGIFGGDPLTAHNYSKNGKPMTNMQDTDGVYQLYYPKTKEAITIDAKGRSWREVPTEGLKGVPNEKTDLANVTRADTDDIATWLELNNKPSVKIKNVFDGVDAKYVDIINHKPGNYLKSSYGNNGMFDLNNPDIFKGLAIPISSIMGYNILNNGEEPDNVKFQKGGMVSNLKNQLNKFSKRYTGEDFFNYFEKNNITHPGLDELRGNLKFRDGGEVSLEDYVNSTLSKYIQ